MKPKEFIKWENTKIYMKLVKLLSVIHEYCFVKLTFFIKNNPFNELKLHWVTF